MKLSKTVWLAVLGVSLAALTATAADKAPGERPARNREQVRERAGELAEQLNLTPEQRPKVQAVMREAAEQRKALREDKTLTPEQRRAKAKEIADQTHAKLKKILTPEQLAKLEELRKQHGGPGQGPGSGHEPGHGGSRKAAK